MWQQVIRLALVTSLLCWSIPARSELVGVRETNWFKFRYQSYRVSTDSCKDLSDVANEFKTGELKIVFADNQPFADGQVRGLHTYVLVLPASELRHNGQVRYQGELRIKWLGVRWYKKYEATLVGSWSEQGFDFRVRYRPKESGDCWKERYLRSPAEPPPV